MKRFVEMKEKIKNINYILVKKGSMNTGLTVLPYSRKALEILAATLKIHRSMVWLDPVTSRISIKQFDLSDKELDAQP